MLFTYTTYCLHILYTSSSQAWKIFERNLQRVPSSSGRRRRRSVCDSFRDGAASWRPAFVQASACSKDKRGGPTPQVVWRQQLGERHRHAFPSFSSQRSQVMPERLLVARTRSARTRLLRRQFGDKRTRSWRRGTVFCICDRLASKPRKSGHLGCENRGGFLYGPVEAVRGLPRIDRGEGATVGPRGASAAQWRWSGGAGGGRKRRYVA